MSLRKVGVEFESSQSSRPRLGVGDVRVDGAVVARHRNELGQLCMGQGKTRIEFDGTSEILDAAFKPFGGTLFAPAASANIELIGLDTLRVALGQAGCVLTGKFDAETGRHFAGDIVVNR